MHASVHAGDQVLTLTGKRIDACEDSRMLQQHKQHRIEQHYH